MNVIFAEMKWKRISSPTLHRQIIFILYFLMRIQSIFHFPYLTLLHFSSTSHIHLFQKGESKKAASNLKLISPRQRLDWSLWADNISEFWCFYFFLRIMKKIKIFSGWEKREKNSLAIVQQKKFYFPFFGARKILRRSYCVLISIMHVAYSSLSLGKV